MYKCEFLAPVAFEMRASRIDAWHMRGEFLAPVAFEMRASRIDAWHMRGGHSCKGPCGTLWLLCAKCRVAACILQSRVYAQDRSSGSRPITNARSRISSPMSVGLGCAHSNDLKNAVRLKRIEATRKRRASDLRIFGRWCATRRACGFVWPLRPLCAGGVDKAVWPPGCVPDVRED
jgi:hypothetical protein